MPIPQHFIDELLDRVDIVEVIDKRINLKKTGKIFQLVAHFMMKKHLPLVLIQINSFFIILDVCWW